MSRVLLRTGERWFPVPSPPPLALAKAFSRSGGGRIFLLFSKVMRGGLSTGPGARRAGSGLSWPIFSGPHDCADLVNFCQDFVNKQKILVIKAAFDVSPICNSWNRDPTIGISKRPRAEHPKALASLIFVLD